MPALVAGIHVFLLRNKDVDGQDEPGHDNGEGASGPCFLHFASQLM
jgi:hypothetical protein